mgnify:CR=1 FL=1|jgi:hypothetical protein
MTFLVDCLIERARELLHRMDQDLVSLTIHLKAFGQCLAFSLNHALTGQNHIVEYLVVEYINFASRLIVLLDDIFGGFVDFFGRKLCLH